VSIICLKNANIAALLSSRQKIKVILSQCERSSFVRSIFIVKLEITTLLPRGVLTISCHNSFTQWHLSCCYTHLTASHSTSLYNEEREVLRVELVFCYSVWEDQILCLFNNKIRRRIFGCRRDVTMEGRRTQPNEELHTLFASPRIAWVIK